MKPLSEMTNAELNESFCIEALGWTKDSSGDETVWLNAAGKYTCGIYDLEFAQSLDAVLPWLEKHRVNIHKRGQGWFVAIWTDDGTSQPNAFDASLARAAVIALISAKRMESH